MKKIMLLALVLTFAFSMSVYAQMGMGRAGVHHNTKVVNVEEAKALVLQQTCKSCFCIRGASSQGNNVYY